MPLLVEKKQLHLPHPILSVNCAPHISWSVFFPSEEFLLLNMKGFGSARWWWSFRPTKLDTKTDLPWQSLWIFMNIYESWLMTFYDSYDMLLQYILWYVMSQFCRPHIGFIWLLWVTGWDRPPADSIDNTKDVHLSGPWWKILSEGNMLKWNGLVVTLW